VNQAIDSVIGKIDTSSKLRSTTCSRPRADRGQLTPDAGASGGIYGNTTGGSAGGATGGGSSSYGGSGAAR
jgi:hypothetical protein